MLSIVIIITRMAIPKKLHPHEQSITAVYEKGVLRPLQRLRLKEQSRVLITLYPERKWRSEFDRLRRRMKARTKAVPQSEVEREISQARAEVKAQRRAARRST
jgi:predicted DNA-binding antitoxin AbrB/MazE fold protein